ncbi:MAG: BTAD domain-containing putative transcriptional regulator, partial [Kibdelosporangium sp.]
MEFQLLGQVVVSVGGRAVDAGSDRQRCVLVALAVDISRVVSVQRLTERVWGEDPPPQARATLLSYVSRLRQVLADTEIGIVRRAGGYVLEADPSAVDLHRFRDLCAQARAGAGDDQRVMRLLEQALALWRGEALTGLGGNWAAAQRDQLHQERLDAECGLTDVLLRLGHGKELVAGLATRTAAAPLDERVAHQYMLALYRAGR